MDGPHVIQDANYRRGVVLGLTIGEAILLLLFSLLLVLAVPLIQQAEKNRELAAELARVRDQRENAEAVLSEAKKRIEQIAPGKGIEDVTKEYVLMITRFKSMEATLALQEAKLAEQRATLAAQDAKLVAQQKGATAFQQLVEAMKGKPANALPSDPAALTKEMVAEISTMQQVTGTAESVLGEKISGANVAKAQQALKDLAADAKKADLANLKESELIDRVAKAEAALKERQHDLSNARQELLKKGGELSGAQQELASNRQELSRTQQELANTKGQLANVMRQVTPGGRGVEAVPCWVSREGKPEYIFDVALTTPGLKIRDRKLPHRREEQAALPLADIPFDSEVSPDRFLLATKRLFEWSRERECRFFVRAFDVTGETEKAVYKRHLRFLETHFYKYEELNERF
jgi:hypothetical protein